jgi:hypothetical protein
MGSIQYHDAQVASIQYDLSRVSWGDRSVPISADGLKFNMIRQDRFHTIHKPYHITQKNSLISTHKIHIDVLITNFWPSKKNCTVTSMLYCPKYQFQHMQKQECWKSKFHDAWTIFAQFHDYTATINFRISSFLKDPAKVYNLQLGFPWILKKFHCYGPAAENYAIGVYVYVYTYKYTYMHIHWWDSG